MLMKGQKIGDRYQIVRVIGEGGMANVYLAKDTLLDRLVAVKVLRGDLADDEKFIKRFHREANAAATLNHPNIVTLYDVGEDENYIVMEFVDGQTLKNLVKKRGSLTPYEVVDIMKQVCDGIAYAHDSYIIHRDIKPQNIMILDDGMVKIMDFGIATAINRLELTQTNSVLGSVHYLPPEQANGGSATIKSDIYSLGIMMYELLTGKVPFKGENPVEIAIKQMKENMPSVTKNHPEIPQSVENIILKCCAKNPKNRYDSVREMKKDLEECLSEEHANDRKIVYKNPEHDLEETKVMPVIKEPAEEVKTEVKKNKKLNKLIFIMTCVCFALAMFIGIAAIIYPKITEVKEVKVPDVSTLTQVDAEKKLKQLGFTVATEVEEKNSSEIDVGLVIATKPIAGRTLKKGTEVTLVISLGEKGLVLENYTGKDYYETKAFLETNEIYVLTEKVEVDPDSKQKENVILKQSPAAGTKVVPGDTVTLYIPDIITEYPDMVAEGWTIEQAEAFCEEYNITLRISYEEHVDYPEGTIIQQSRAAGSKVVSPTTLVITVTSIPEE